MVEAKVVASFDYDIEIEIWQRKSYDIKIEIVGFDPMHGVYIYIYIYISKYINTCELMTHL